MSARELKPGEPRPVEIIIDPKASNHPLSVRCEAEHRWIVPEGQFALWLGRSSSSADLMLAGRFHHQK
ncbi:fibronectin type III-like domain-contianing protein [Sphingobium herbicidovorans]